MNIAKGKIVLFVMLSVLTLTATKAMSNTMYMYQQNLVFLDGAATDAADKLITNVKVFYNPIAEQVTVNFKLGKQATVTIKVMDALGNEVVNLLNGRLDAGVQNLSLAGNSKLTSGVYFVRVSSGTETIIKRISVR